MTKNAVLRLVLTSTNVPVVSVLMGVKSVMVPRTVMTHQMRLAAVSCLSLEIMLDEIH